MFPRKQWVIGSEKARKLRAYRTRITSLKESQTPEVLVPGLLGRALTETVSMTDSNLLQTSKLTDKTKVEKQPSQKCFTFNVNPKYKRYTLSLAR